VNDQETEKSALYSQVWEQEEGGWGILTMLVKREQEHVFLMKAVKIALI
jgi:hypothetical protein